ncbi:MAG: hypothetical protein ACRD1U_13585 [Vicinamibacterales bacterium]
MKATFLRRIGILALTLAAASCGSTVREGTGTSFLIIRGLEAASGATPDEFSGTLNSDVITIVDDVPTIFNDVAVVTFGLGVKDPGSATSPNAPTQNQSITVDRYSVRYIRADGRNTPGVDVPYGFDGSFTVTVGEQDVEGAFQLVRHLAKQEAPLATLATSPVVIATIAEITFYGRDLTGHEVTAVGRISIDFGNFGDPDQ